MNTQYAIKQCIKALTDELHFRVLDPIVTNELLTELTKLEMQLEKAYGPINFKNNQQKYTKAES